MAYKHDTVVPYNNSSNRKKEQVATMFNTIASKYDFFNRFLSAGIDVYWRKKALKKLRGKPILKMLDMATGTADVALLAQKILQPNYIIGLDISSNMIAVGNDKIQKANLQHKIELSIGDSEAINYPASTFDAATVAFGVRNFENLEAGLSELHRVLKNDSTLVVLEFSKPKHKIWRNFYNLYNGFIAPKFVSIFSKNKSAYTYLSNSINAFPERENFIAVLQKVGYKNCYYQPLSLGICCIYVAQK